LNSAARGTGGLALLRAGAARLGFALSEEQVLQFQAYYEILVDWNSRINLTAITEYEAVQVRHFVDSLTVGAALLEELRPAGEDRPTMPPAGFSLVDIGAGAGFPGLPLKILWPRLALTLNDSVGKKTAFLREVARELGLDGVEILAGRAEELGLDKKHRANYSAATARAVATLPVLCEYCLPLVRVGGHLAAPKKGDISQELEEAKRAAQILGGSEPRIHRFLLPREDVERFVVTVGKTKPTPPGYPRRVGLPSSRPLGKP
jgi:16S rRNA (guanine527-N7)-methyltransferase